MPNHSYPNSFTHVTLPTSNPHTISHPCWWSLQSCLDPPNMSSFTSSIHSFSLVPPCACPGEWHRGHRVLPTLSSNVGNWNCATDSFFWDLEKFGVVLVLPVPDLLQEMRHVDLLRSDLDHPWMLSHPPWCRSSRWIFLETAVQC